MVALSAAVRSSFRNDLRIRSIAGAIDGKSTTTSSAKQLLSTRHSSPETTTELRPNGRKVRPLMNCRYLRDRKARSQPYLRVEGGACRREMLTWRRASAAVPCEGSLPFPRGSARSHIRRTAPRVPPDDPLRKPQPANRPDARRASAASSRGSSGRSHNWDRSATRGSPLLSSTVILLPNAASVLIFDCRRWDPAAQCKLPPAGLFVAIFGASDGNDGQFGPFQRSAGYDTAPP